MIIKNYKPFTGQHCETTATGSLLRNLDIELSEPMLFGIGEGLSYIWWNAKNMPRPFIGGRNKPDSITQNICRNLDFNLETRETTSVIKAWENVRQYIDQNIVVGLKLDCYYLEYFTDKIHFPAHYVAIYGYDDNYAFLTDTQQQDGRVKTSLESLLKARNEKGPMSSDNLSYTIRKKESHSELTSAVKKALKNNSVAYLNPPIQNISYKGIQKTAKEIFKWFNSSADRRNDFILTATLMEKAGTGGSLFRNIYRDFLTEAANLLEDNTLLIASVKCNNIAIKWNLVSKLFEKAGINESVVSLNEASEILLEIAAEEMEMMKLIFSI
jgi:hypothetical protein